MGRPRIENGYDFDGSPMRRVTFDLRSPDYAEQIERFFADNPDLEAADETLHGPSPIRVNYPSWICHDCGVKHGRVKDGCATYHVGSECGWCGTTVEPVTEPRDYGYPKPPSLQNLQGIEPVPNAHQLGDQS